MAPLIQILRERPELSPAAAGQLQRFASERARTAAEARCEFCGSGIDDTHGHLVDLSRRALLCVCRPCYLLFTHDGAGGVRFRAVPTRYALVRELASSSNGWEALDLPIGLAFFFQDSASGRTTAFYPSPAGATESELPLAAWTTLTSDIPILSTMIADVEALLVRKTSAGTTALIVPIDACYELVGLVRVVWRGLQGGDELQRRVDEFFSRAVERAGSAVEALDRLSTRPDESRRA
jgi:hypothetical protein